MDDYDFRVIELTVNNHAGVMSHVTGLFSRRGFNLEGIICGKIGDGKCSRIYLLVQADQRLEQLLKQLSKLYDVIEATLKDENCPVAKRFEKCVETGPCSCFKEYTPSSVFQGLWAGIGEDI